MAELILPGSLEFEIALAGIPPVPTWRAEAERTNGETYLICRAGSLGLMEAVTRQEWEEYCNDGELDERQLEIDAHDQALEGVVNV
jgi:hypothetical protein